MRSPEDTRAWSPGTPAPHQAGELFRAEQVGVRFGGLVALEDVSLAVHPGTVHGVIGPNGAGKTTLFNVCCGFVRPDSGTLHWRGEPVRDLRPYQLAGMGIARTLQGVGLFTGLSVLENVMVGGDSYRKARFISALLALPRSAADERALRERAERAMDELGVLDHATRSPASLPYPVQKRVAIARALAAAPELLLLDEPASGLGQDDIQALAELVRRLAERTSIVAVDHHMDFVMSICDRITVLDFGRVVAEGSPDEITDDPAVLSAYLGEDVDSPDGADRG